MLYSKRIEKQAKKEKLTVDEMAMADLMLLGYADMDAYLITHQSQKVYGEEYITKQIRPIVISSEFLKYSERRSRAMKRDSTKIENEDTEDDGVLWDKEKIAQELLSSARALPVGSKERVDAMMKYADLLQMKKDAVEEEDVIHYYLPLSCHKCELYLKTKTEKL